MLVSEKWACVKLRGCHWPAWPLLAFEGLGWVFIGLCGCCGLRWLLWACVGLRWPSGSGLVLVGPAGGKISLV